MTVGSVGKGPKSLRPEHNARWSFMSPGLPISLLTVHWGNGGTVRGNRGTVTYTSLWKGDRKESTMIVHCGSQEMRRWKQER